MQVELRYGVFLPKLEEQVNEQGLTFGDDSDLVEELRDAYNMLRFHLKFTDNQKDIILKKLNATVISHIKHKKNK